VLWANELADTAAAWLAIIDRLSEGPDGPVLPSGLAPLSLCLAGGEFPDPHCPVAGAGGKPGAVRAERHR